MIILALDTTLGACSVAVTRDEQTLAQRSEDMERGHAERLAPMAEEVMRAAGLPFAALDRIAVTTGPGSFTGVRVGLAFARGLALAVGRPCVGISTLEVLAREGGDAGVQTAIIALSNTTFLAAYESGVCLLAPSAFAPDDAASALSSAIDQKRATLRGPGAAMLAARISQTCDHHDVSAGDVETLARLAASRAPDQNPPSPLYLRAPNIKPPS